MVRMELPKLLINHDSLFIFCQEKVSVGDLYFSASRKRRLGIVVFDVLKNLQGELIFPAIEVCQCLAIEPIGTSSEGFVFSLRRASDKYQGSNQSRRQEALKIHNISKILCYDDMID